MIALSSAPHVRRLAGYLCIAHCHFAAAFFGLHPTLAVSSMLSRETQRPFSRVLRNRPT
jgi:hypothetical protein